MLSTLHTVKRNWLFIAWSKIGMYAIATLVMGGDTYVPAAIALAKSILTHVKMDTMELVCLITSDVESRDILRRYYHHVHIVEKITVSNIPKLGGTSAMKIYHWISDAPTKWNILALDSYEKVLFLDADMIVLQDILELFHLDTPAAMFDHQAAREYSIHPSWTGHRDKGNGFINWYKVSLGLETKKGPLPPGYKVGSVDGILPLTTGTKIPTECIDNLRLHSNSQFAMHGGIVLIKPDKTLLDMYKEKLPLIIDSLCMKSKIHRDGSNHESCWISHEYVKTDRTLSGIDEITLTLFMHDIGCVWTHIGMEYNVAAYHTYGIFRDRTKILHYIGCYKPWNKGVYGVSEREYVASKCEQNENSAYKLYHEVTELWWNIYDSPTLHDIPSDDSIMDAYAYPCTPIEEC